jgi:hypothetical protein
LSFEKHWTLDSPLLLPTLLKLQHTQMKIRPTDTINHLI